MDEKKGIYNRILDYIYDSSIDLKERTFMVFSGAVLVALFLAVPFGLIMQEPASATISTIVGAVFFTLYVIYAYRQKRIKTAKIIISVILVFIFLPAMFFTNGGVEGGAPIWLLLGTIYIALILEGKFKIAMFISEGATGYPSMTAKRRNNAAHGIEVIGEQLRSMMPWIAANKIVDKAKN